MASGDDLSSLSSGSRTNSPILSLSPDQCFTVLQPANPGQVQQQLPDYGSLTQHSVTPVQTLAQQQQQQLLIKHERLSPNNLLELTNQCIPTEMHQPAVMTSSYSPILPADAGYMTSSASWASSDASLTSPGNQAVTFSSAAAFTSGVTTMTSANDATIKDMTSQIFPNPAPKDQQNKPVNKQKPKRKRIITHDQRSAANVRERRRMVTLNDAFDELKQRIPTFSHEKKLSRIETLRLAMAYIKFMSQMLDGKPQHESPNNIRYDNSQSNVFKNTAYVINSAADQHPEVAMDASFFMDQQSRDNSVMQQAYYSNSQFIQQ